MLVGVGNESVISGRLNEAAQEAAGVFSCHSGGVGDGGEKGAFLASVGGMTPAARAAW